MITRELKLKLTKKQQNEIDTYLYHLTSVYNWTIRAIELNANNKIYLSYFDLQNTTSNHAKKIGVNSQVFQGIIKQAYNAWDRCFKGLAKKPKLKSVRNKLRSFTFPQFQRKNLFEKKIKLPSIGLVRYSKQDVPEGNIKQVKIIKKASGYYAILIIDANHTFPILQTTDSVGIDTGFKHLAILSNGEKYANSRPFIKAQNRLAQAQRGKNKKLVARMYEHIKNKRKDTNHKISKDIVSKYKTIAITNDNLRKQSKVFGKSVMDAGISQLRNFILYKGANHNRDVKLVDSKYTTMTCSNCGSLTGPSGRDKLAVRTWECSVCRTVLDRDINSANVILKFGFGINLEQCYNVNRKPISFKKG